MANIDDCCSAVPREMGWNQRLAAINVSLTECESILNEILGELVRESDELKQPSGVANAMDCGIREAQRHAEHVLGQLRNLWERF